MPYGTDSFTDRYGDYKQPTIVDYDNQSVTIVSNLSETECLANYDEDIKSVLKEVLETNPFFAGTRYVTLVESINGKLAWNTKKIDEMKSNTDWLFELRKYLNKAKTKFNLNKKL